MFGLGCRHLPPEKQKGRRLAPTASGSHTPHRFYGEGSLSRRTRWFASTYMWVAGLVVRSIDEIAACTADALAPSCHEPDAATGWPVTAAERGRGAVAKAGRPAICCTLVSSIAAVSVGRFGIG